MSIRKYCSYSHMRQELFILATDIDSVLFQEGATNFNKVKLHDLFFVLLYFLRVKLG